MDYLSSYTASLLEQSRFYFPPLAAMRSALQESRPPPPIAVPNDSSSATVAAAAAAAGVTSLAPFVELGLLHGRGGPREREIPLDLSMKTIRQTPDSTADDDVIVLEHRRNSARNHALQVAAAIAAGKLPFAFGAAAAASVAAAAGVPSRLGDPFMAPPHPSLFSHDHLSPLLQPTPTTSAASMVSSPAVYRCPPGSEGSSAFLTPPANLHAAVCGGLNGFCLDPHRCRLASLSAVANASSNAARQHPTFQMPSPFSTISSSSAAAAAAAAAVMYERQMAKLIPSSGSASLGGGDNSSTTLQGLTDLHMPSPMPSVSSTSATSTSSPSVDALKHHFQSGSLTAERYLSSFALPSSLGLPMYHHQHHPHSKDVTAPCSCCLPKSFPLPCVCCYPSAPHRGFETHPTDSMFNCCQPPSIPVVPSSGSDLTPPTMTQSHSTSKSDIKDKVKRDPSSSTTAQPGGNSKPPHCHPTNAKSHHHHHHHHHHQTAPCKVSGSSASGFSKTASPHPQTPTTSPLVQAQCGSPLPVKDEHRQTPVHHHPTSPSKRQPEGGRWIPHQHSHSHKDKSAVNKKQPSSCTDALSGSKTTKVFAPVVHIQPSQPMVQVQPNTISSPPALPPPTEFFAALSQPSSEVMSSPDSQSLVAAMLNNTSSCPIQSQPGERPAESPIKLIPTLKQEPDTSNGTLPGSGEANIPSKRSPSPSHCLSPLKREPDRQTPPSSLQKSVVAPATIGRWMLSPPTTIKTESEEQISSSPHLAQPNPKGLGPNSDGVSHRRWDSNYALEDIATAVVSPIVTTKKPNAALEHPASPAEGCSPTSAEPKTTEMGIEVMSGLNSVAPIPDSSYTSSFIAPSTIAIKLQKDEQHWKMPPMKRSHCDTDTLPSKKKKRKDGTVFSLKEEHQTGHKENQLLKSAKQKLEDDSEVQHPAASSQGEDGFYPMSVAIATAAVVPPQFLQQMQQERQQQLSSPLAHQLANYKALTTNGKLERHKKQPSPAQPTQSRNNDIGTVSCTPKTNCNNNSNSSNSVSGYKNSINSGGLEDHGREARLPPIGVTLVKTAHQGTNQYKSSILNSSPKITSCSNEDTTAMLRLYYEQQKQRLQESYNQRLLNEASYKAPKPLSSVNVSQFPATTTTTVTNKRKKCSVAKHPQVHHRHHHHHHSYDGSAHAPNSTDSTQQRKPSIFYRPEDEDARDGDDEREDDGSDDRCKQNGETKRCPPPPAGGQHKAGIWHMAEPEVGLKNLEAESHVQSSHTISPVTSLPETSPSATQLGHSGTSTLVPASGRSESTKRLMINKALGETMLHRAARLGYLDVISYCLEAQGVAIDVRDNAGNTPLHECCSRGHLEIARLLLQHGADPNASATGGIRPVHDAVENDQLEIVRLLLSYGADPLLATYSGLTPLKLARSPMMLEFLKGYLADISGESDAPFLPWQFHGSARFFDPWPTGYDPLGDLPSDEECNDVHGDDDDVDNAAALIFEVSDKPHIPTYRVPTSRGNGSGILSFCLLQDVLHQTGMDRDAFLSCYPDIVVETMPRQEFATRAKCTQLMVDINAALQGACLSSPWVDLVRWDDGLRDILDIERVTIPRMDE